MVKNSFMDATKMKVDTSKLGLRPDRMSGPLALETVAFEHRLAVMFSLDGIYDT